ncbi:protein phosphatase 2C domain-containing protein [Kitasatospora viridis]|uniref:Protein phosphatase 2C-like protein n=1 Tax=Kitasatospora viridis TaxID=281105 RepID=A0A561UHG5_9ACTN|nr:protein phosphatase 2C domain-containing protein [Kitasatospora viridis]TWF98794.1 protein phosphatase 2C-like protein [Kitasatospora viridis]
MRIEYLTEAMPGGRGNEDFVLAGDGFAVLLDGATASGSETGCVHQVSWVARRLGAELARILVARPELSLREVLRAGVTALRELHGDGCDLTNPDSPSATVAMVRWGSGRLDHLVLADSPVLVELADGELLTVLDDRVERLPAYDRATVARLRNAPGGFWVASTRPEAADQALTGSHPLAGVRRFAVLTDGVSRLVERYGWSWRALLDGLAQGGPAQLLAAVREAELADPPGRFAGKRHDDATVLFGRPDPADLVG